MSGWDRRTFLKTGAAGAAGLTLDRAHALVGPPNKPWNASTGRSLRKFRDPAPTVCRMCPAHCGIVACRDGDRVVQVLGSQGAPNNQGGVCSRAFAGLERLYDGERKLHPLRREGPRGSGAWRRISWEEALAELRGRLDAARGRSVLHLGQDELAVQELRGLFGWSEILVDRPLAGRAGPGSGERWYGAPVLGTYAARARTVFLFGVRPLDGRFQVPLARDLVKAREHGGALYLFDCLEESTGSLAEWHPTAPGSVATVAYGIARLLLDWGAYDREAAAERLAESPEVLRAALESYSPEAVQAATGLPAAVLVSLARTFSERAPALALADHASPAAPAAALLNHLVGTVNRPGGVATARGSFFLRPLRPTVAPGQWLEQLALGGARTDLYWAVDANPAYDAPQSEAVAAALADPERVGFLVAMDTHLTETAALADLFLPRTTHFEAWDLVEGCLPDGRPYLFLQQPVTRPASEPDKLKDPATPHLELFGPAPRALGEARSLPDVLLGLARGRPDSPLPFATTRDCLFELLRRSWGPGSLEALARRGIWVSGEARPPAATAPVSLATAIPALPPAGAEAASPGLHLVRYTPATLPHTYANTRWGREIAHEFRALLHPATAARLGVGDGDRLVLRVDGRETEATARLIRGIHPGAVALPDGFGHRAGSVARAEAEKGRRRLPPSSPGDGASEAEPGAPIWWSHAGPGSSVNALFPFRLGEEGGQDWRPVPVEVRRA